MDWNVLFFSLLVGQYSMSMREGTSFDILTRKSHIEAFLEQRTISQSFSSTKVDIFSSLDWLLPLLINLLDSWIDVETFRNSGYLCPDFSKHFFTDACSLDLSQLGEVNNAMIGGTSPHFDIESTLQALGIGFTDFRELSGPDCLDLFFSCHSFFNQLFSIDVIKGWSLSNGLIHHGLSKTKNKGGYTLVDPAHYVRISCTRWYRQRYLFWTSGDRLLLVWSPCSPTQAHQRWHGW